MESMYHTLDAQVSVFNGVKKSTPVTNTTIRNILNRIKNCEDKDHIDLLREKLREANLIEDEKEREKKVKEIEYKYKLNLTSYTFSGTFSIRKNENQLSSSGFISVDFDDVIDIPLTKELINDDYLFCSFISPSGNGIKAIYKITVEEDDKKWSRRAESLLEYLKGKFSKEIHEKQFKIDHLPEISRLCITSYDEELYVYEDSWIWDKIKPEIQKPKVEYSLIPNPNIDNKIILDRFERKIVDFFSNNNEKGNRNSRMAKFIPLIKSNTLFHKLDEDYIISLCLREYEKLFTQYEVEDERKALIGCWKRSNKLPPQPIDEIYAISNNIQIEEDICGNVRAGIFNSEKAKNLPSEEELRLMYVDIFNKKRSEICRETILNIGNFFGVVATGSSGKTSMVNAVIAQVLAPKERKDLVKKIHFTITENVKRILVFDSELDFIDFRKFYNQLLLRIGLPNTYENIKLLQDSELVNYFSMSEYSISEGITDPIIPFKKLIEDAVAEGNPYSLVILDDITIFTPDVNDSSQIQSKYLEFKRLARKYNFGIFATIHANSGDHVGKARGHSGSELERKAETVLHITRDNATELFEITLGVGNKNRHGGLTFAMHDNPLLAEWSDLHNCIIGIDTNDTQRIKEERKQEFKPKSIIDSILEYLTPKFENQYKKVDSIMSEEVRQWIADWYAINNQKVTNDTIKGKLSEVSKKIDVNVANYEQLPGKAGVFYRPAKSRNFADIIKDEKVLDEKPQKTLTHLEKLHKEDNDDLARLGAKIDKDSEIDFDNMFNDL